MAEVTPQIAFFKSANVVHIKWAALAFNVTGDTGIPVELHEFANRQVQISGTFGTGGSVSLMGSTDGVTYAALADVDGVEITKTAAATVYVHKLLKYIRPEVTAGNGSTAIDVTLIG